MYEVRLLLSQIVGNSASTARLLYSASTGDWSTERRRLVVNGVTSNRSNTYGLGGARPGCRLGGAPQAIETWCPAARNQRATHSVSCSVPAEKCGKN